MTSLVDPLQIPFDVWDTKMYFLYCFLNKRFELLIEFFNIPDRSLYKNIMLYLCIFFFDQDTLNSILSKVKIKICNKEVINSNIKDKFNYERNGHLLIDTTHPSKGVINSNMKDVTHSSKDVTYPSIDVINSSIDITHSSKDVTYPSIDEFKLRKNTTISTFERSLTNELKSAKKDNLYEDFEKRSKIAQNLFKLSKYQIDNLYIIKQLNYSWFLVLYFINGYSVDYIIETLSLDKVNKLLYYLNSISANYLLNYCSSSILRDLFQKTNFINYITLNQIRLFNKETMSLVVDNMIKNNCFVHEIIYNSSIMLSSIYLNTKSFFEMYEDLTSLISTEHVTFILKQKNIKTINLLIQYVKNVSSDPLMNSLIDFALENNKVNLIQYIYEKNKLTLFPLLLHCYDAETNVIEKIKANKIKLILLYLAEHSQIYIKKYKKMILFIESKIESN